MTSVHVLDNQSLPSTLQPSNWAGGTITVGARFTIAGSRTVYNLLWFKTTTNVVPTKLKLWDDSGTLLETITPTGPYQLGWNTCALGTPRSLSAGTYRVSLYMPSSGDWAAINSGAVATPPTGVSWPTDWRCYNGSGDSFPTTTDHTYGPWAVDVSLDAADTLAPDSPQPSTSGDISNSLTAWLADNSDNTHRAGDTVPGLPDTTKVVVDAISGDTTVIATEVAGLHTKIDADGVTWDAKLGPLQLYGGVTSRGISAGVDIVRTDLAGKASQSSLDAAATEISAIAASVALALALKRNALVDFPSAPWVMTNETAFDTDIAYAEEADLYVVTFTGLGSNLVNTVVAGVDVSYRLAWWAPLIGAFVQQRRFVDTPSAHLWLDGTRLPGVLLHSPAGAAGTIQAWTYA